jgi:hypothetical protein
VVSIVDRAAFGAGEYSGAERGRQSCSPTITVGAQLVVQRRQGQLASLRQFQVCGIVQSEPEAIG